MIEPVEIELDGIGTGTWVLPSEVQAISFTVTPTDCPNLLLTLRGGATVEVSSWMRLERLRGKVPEVWAQLRGTEDPYR